MATFRKQLVYIMNSDREICIKGVGRGKICGVHSDFIEFRLAHYKRKGNWFTGIFEEHEEYEVDDYCDQRLIPFSQVIITY